MSELNSLEYTVLAERLSAQTEAYEKFAQAFVRILELIDKSGDKVQDLQTQEGQYFRELLQSIVRVADDLKVHESATKGRDDDNNNKLKRSNETLARSFDEIKENQRLITEVVNAIVKTQGEEFTMIRNMHAELTAFAAHVKTNLETMKEMPFQLNDLHAAKKGWKERSRSVFIYIGAIVTILAAIQVLIQLNILHLTWWNK